MARCPFAVWKPLPENNTQGRIEPRIAILHSAGGGGSLWRFFFGSSPLESNFWIDWDGTIEQYMDTEVRADANLNANQFAVSIETASSSGATEPWTAAQVASIIRLVDWLCTVHPNIKRQLCDGPYGSGIGWHIMFGTPGPWTPVAKACPGPARIIQTKNIIIPAVINRRVPSSGGFLMALNDAQQNEVLQLLRRIDQNTEADLIVDRKQELSLASIGALAKDTRVYAARAYAYAKEAALFGRTPDEQAAVKSAAAITDPTNDRN